MVTCRSVSNKMTFSCSLHEDVKLVQMLTPRKHEHAVFKTGNQLEHILLAAVILTVID